MANLYNNYFAKDKPLRHYSQHLMVAFVGFISLPLVGVSINQNVFWKFLIASYIVDLDGLISVFVFRSKIKEAGKIVDSLFAFKFMQSATLGTIHHKKLNKLILHNIVGLAILLLGLVGSIIADNGIITLWLWAVLFHFSFDIFDDFYQLGHVNNWLWPMKYFFRSQKHTF